jgi:IS30 family transposase
VHHLQVKYVALKGGEDTLKYKHLTLEEREKLFAYRALGKPFRWIAKRLGRSHSTLARELKRPKYGKEYLPCIAQREADRIMFRQRQRAALKNPTIFLFVREHLRPPYSWSPETIAGRLPLIHKGQSICTESIYRYVYLNKKTKREKLWQYLELHRRKRMKKEGRKVKSYSKLSEAIPIQMRPEIINKRLELGHWETDNMEGKRSDKGAVSVTTERVTRKVKLTKLNGHTAKIKTEALINQLKIENKGFVKSITFDRGPENSWYKVIGEKLEIDTYACNPYHSWEKGTVENTIKRLRRFVPKGISIDNVTQEYLTALEDKFNNTPRKVLGFLTPNEYYERIHSASYV